MDIVANTETDRRLMGFKIIHEFVDAPALAGITVEQMPLYGIERVAGVDDSLPKDGRLIDFRLYDDDQMHCFTGELNDDAELLNQQAALRWGETQAGCTTIKVRRAGGWKQEIG